MELSGFSSQGESIRSKMTEEEISSKLVYAHVCQQPSDGQLYVVQDFQLPLVSMPLSHNLPFNNLIVSRPELCDSAT